jgi:murein DD-endopeptidase MepM/ murein hydrolase activator NlpD
MLQPTPRPSGISPVEVSSTANPGVSSGSNPQKIKEVSQEFEALLLSQVFKAMRQTVPKSDFLGNVRDRDWYADLFDFELAKTFTHGSKSLGLSAYLQQDLQRMQDRQEPRLHPEAAGSSIDHRPGAMSSAKRRSQAAASLFESPSEALTLPVVGRLSSHYGERSDPSTGEAQYHHGIDITGSLGTEIRAALPGTVTYSGWIRGYGQTVILSHENGLTTHYAHNSANFVQPGEHVGRGQPIALVGQSGRATGPHVHFEVRKDGRAIDPMPLFDQKTVI